MPQAFLAVYTEHWVNVFFKNLLLAELAQVIVKAGFEFDQQRSLVHRHSLILGLLPSEEPAGQEFQRSPTLIFSFDFALVSSLSQIGVPDPFNDNLNLVKLVCGLIAYYHQSKQSSLVVKAVLPTSS
jgi:hypothetical protein